MTPKNGFLLFLTSCLSGCGQMYQGYMKRGLSLLLAFFLVIFVSTYFYLGTLALFLPVIWLYAFFDSYSLRSQLAHSPADGVPGAVKLLHQPVFRRHKLLETVGSLLNPLSERFIYLVILCSRHIVSPFCRRPQLHAVSRPQISPARTSESKIKPGDEPDKIRKKHISIGRLPACAVHCTNIQRQRKEPRSPR